MINKIIHGDALAQLENLHSESVDCCITSPPYWALRDYKVDGQLGLEPTFQEYIDKLCDIFDQVKRVLKKTGACWVVMGDTYAGTGHKGSYDQRDPKYKAGRNGQDFAINNKVEGIPDKSLCMIPERFAIEMINRGWILRNKIIWHKPNCMPSSAKDRFTVDYETVFFFTKSQRYYFETQYEPQTELSLQRGPHAPKNKKDTLGMIPDVDRIWEYNPLGRIKRCVFKQDTLYSRMRTDLPSEKKEYVVKELIKRGLL